MAMDWTRTIDDGAEKIVEIDWSYTEKRRQQYHPSSLRRDPAGKTEEIEDILYRAGGEHV